jgi:hypothetical protein
MHAGVRKEMEQQLPGTKWISMYDLPIVSMGFVGPPVAYNKKMGIRASDADLEDFVYCWRCIGYQLGIDDKFNVCSLGKDNATGIVKDFVNEVLLPAIANPPADYGPMAGAYIDGMNLLALGFPFWSIKSTLAVSFWAFGAPRGRLSTPDLLRYYVLRILLFIASLCPPFGGLLNWATRASLSQGQALLARSSLGGISQCPFTGAQMRTGSSHCPVYSGSNASRDTVADSTPGVSPIGVVLLVLLILIGITVALAILVGLCVSFAFLSVVSHALLPSFYSGSG